MEFTTTGGSQMPTPIHHSGKRMSSPLLFIQNICFRIIPGQLNLRAPASYYFKLRRTEEDDIKHDQLFETSY